MKRLIAFAIATATLVAPTAALADDVPTIEPVAITFEEGATFTDDGGCFEADGTFGISTAWGECVTPADYAERFSFEALSEVDSATGAGSVAEVYNLEPSTPANERLIGVGIIDNPFTFDEYVMVVNGIIAL